MIPILSGLQQVVHYTFLIAFFGMIAASLFFAFERTSVAPSYRLAVTLGSIITAIAGMNYFYMKDIYVVGIASGGNAFPTHFRYIDWILTVPLMLVKLPAMLGLGPKGRRFLTVLVTLAIVMIVSSFIGEVNPANSQLHFGLFAVGCVAWLIIVALILFSLTDLPEHVDPIKRSAIKKMGMFIFFGWLIYPVGYLMPTFGLTPDFRELLYNVGDLINKIGLALVVFSAGVAAKKQQDEITLSEPYPMTNGYEDPLPARA